MGKRLLRREHLVAASLVGTVVVVVGYASGLGLRPMIGTDAPTTDAEVAAPRPPAAEQPAPTTTPPVQPAADPGARRVVRQGPATAAPLPTPPPTSDRPRPPHPHPQPPTPPGTPPPPTPPPCQPGLVPAALETLLRTLDRATDALGLLTVPAVVPLPVADGAAPLAAAEGTPLDQLLRACPPAS